MWFDDNMYVYLNQLLHLLLKKVQINGCCATATLTEDGSQNQARTTARTM